MSKVPKLPKSKAISKKKAPKSRNFLFTWNNPPAMTMEELEWKMRKNHAVCGSGQREVGENGTEHF